MRGEVCSFRARQHHSPAMARISEYTCWELVNIIDEARVLLERQDLDSLCQAKHPPHTGCPKPLHGLTNHQRSLFLNQAKTFYLYSFIHSFIHTYIHREVMLCWLGCLDLLAQMILLPQPPDYKHVPPCSAKLIFKTEKLYVKNKRKEKSNTRPGLIHYDSRRFDWGCFL